MSCWSLRTAALPLTDTRGRSALDLKCTQEACFAYLDKSFLNHFFSFCKPKIGLMWVFFFAKYDLVMLRFGECK